MLKHGICLVVCLVSTLAAQVVRTANYSVVPAAGWHRTTVDVRPPLSTGTAGGTPFVVGRQIGRSTWAVDLQLELAAGEQRTVDLGAASPLPWQIGSLPPDPIAHFGGWPSVAGTPLQLASIDVDGSAVSIHFRARLPGLWHTDVWMLWRPDEPGLVHFESVCCASNPAVPDITAAVPAGGLRLVWGDSLAFVAGAGWNAALVPGGQSCATGQARGAFGVLIWPRHMPSAASWLPALTAVSRTVASVGLRTLLPDGNPVTVVSGKAWTVNLYAESLRRLHTFDPPMIGPARSSGDSGSQEDQVFVRGEPFLQDGVGAEQVAYAAALQMLGRPCHHLNADGSIVDPTTAVPRLIYWYGVPHWHEGVSPNRLGKPRLATLEETHGWSGPDVEHWLLNTHAAAARFLPSHALQWGLEHQAYGYWGQWTTTPGWSTTQAYAARARGWEGIAVVHLWNTLEDRGLAERVRLHWLRRAPIVMAASVPEHWDIRTDDGRLGPGDWWIPWQQSVGCYGLDLAGAEIGPPEARDVALRGAKVVLRDAWVKVGSRWQSRAQMPVAGGGPSNEDFNYYGMALAVAVVLRHEPQHEQARSIWQQLIATPERGASWLAPGVVLP